MLYREFVIFKLRRAAGYTRVTFFPSESSPTESILQGHCENLWDASSSACLETGCINFQKARCPGHSTSRRHLNSLFFLATCSIIFIFYSSALLQRRLQQRKRRKAFLEEFFGPPRVQLQLFTLAAHSDHFIVRHTMTSSPTAFLWANPCLTMENLTDGTHSPFLMSLKVEPIWRRLLISS